MTELPHKAAPPSAAAFYSEVDPDEFLRRAYQRHKYAQTGERFTCYFKLMMNFARHKQGPVPPRNSNHVRHLRLSPRQVMKL